MLNSTIVSNINGTLSPHQKVSNQLQTSLLTPLNFTKTEMKTNSMPSNNPLKSLQKNGGRSSSLLYNGQAKFTNSNYDQNRNPQIKHTKMVNGNKNCIDSSEEVMPRPNVVLYRRRINLDWQYTHKIGAGLTNLGNTCFMNTVLQCLTYCPPLANYLLYEGDHSSKCKVSGFCMMCELQLHMKRAIVRSGESIKPNQIYTKLQCIAKHFKFGRQEDAHEFLRYLIEKLWKSCLANHDGHTKLDPASKETTVINQIFGGYHRSQVTCMRCKEKSNTYDHFMDLMLDVKQNVATLEKALDKFILPELLQFENAFKCPNCKMKVAAHKKFTLFKAPNVATFQFKRFDFHNRMFEGKITKHISYPESLNLRPYMSDPKGPPMLYRLNAVLVHLGSSCNSGHYFCYVRNSNGLWYLMDDSRVQQVTLNQVLNQNAYVLFYVRTKFQELHSTQRSENTTSNIKNNSITKNGYISPLNCSSSSNLSLPLNEKSNSLPGISKLSVSQLSNGLQNGTASKLVNKAQIPPFKLQKKRKNSFSTYSNVVAIKTNSSPNFKKNSLPVVVKKVPKSASLVPYVEGSSEDESADVSKANAREISGKIEMPFSAFQNIHAISNDSKTESIPKKVFSSSASEYDVHSAKRNEHKEKLSIKGNGIASKDQVLNELDIPTNENELTKDLSLSNTPRLNASSAWSVTEIGTHTLSVSGSSTNSINSSTDWNIEPDTQRKEVKGINSDPAPGLDSKSNTLHSSKSKTSLKDDPQSCDQKSTVQTVSVSSSVPNQENSDTKSYSREDKASAASVDSNSSGSNLTKLVNGDRPSSNGWPHKTQEPDRTSKEPMRPFRNQSFRKFDKSWPGFKNKKESSPKNSNGSDSENARAKRTTKSFDSGEDSHGSLPKRLKTDNSAKCTEKSSSIIKPVRKIEDDSTADSSSQSSLSGGNHQPQPDFMNKHSSNDKQNSLSIHNDKNSLFKGASSITNSNHSPHSSSSEDMEKYSWVEKTKESMEKESKTKFNTWSPSKHEHNKSSPQKEIPEFQRNSNFLYGKNVGTWNDSHTHERNTSFKHRPRKYSDDYDDELDKGKVRHRKKNNFFRNNYKPNHFQTSANYGNKGNRHEPFRRKNPQWQPRSYQSKHNNYHNQSHRSYGWERPQNHFRH